MSAPDRPELHWFPLHVGDWRKDPRLRRLSKAERADVMELLLDQWEERAVPPRPSDVSDAAWTEFLRIAPRYANERAKRELAYLAQSKGGREGNRKRWGSVPESVPDTPTESVPESGCDRIPDSGIPDSVTSSVPSEPQKKTLATLAATAPPAGGNLLAPFIETWRRVRDGEPSRKRIGEMAAVLHPLIAARGVEAVGRAWLRYLTETKLEDPHATTFAQNFGRWAGTAIVRPRTRAAPESTPEAMAAVLGIMPRRGAL